MTILFYFYALVYILYKIYRLLNSPNEDIIEVSVATAPALFHKQVQNPSTYLAIVNFLWIVAGTFSPYAIFYGFILIISLAVPPIRSQLRVSESIALWRVSCVIQIFLAAIILNLATVKLLIGG